MRFPFKSPSKLYLFFILFLLSQTELYGTILKVSKKSHNITISNAEISLKNDTLQHNHLNASKFSHKIHEKEKKNRTLINNLTDISFAKNYLTFTQLSKGLSSLKAASISVFGRFSKNLGPNAYNYVLLCIGIPFILVLIFCFFKNVKENSRIQEILQKKLSFKNAKNPKKEENTIILKGRTIHRPANQYHYILEKDSNGTISENSDESDDQLENIKPILEENEDSKFTLFDFNNSAVSDIKTSAFITERQFGKIFNVDPVSMNLNENSAGKEKLLKSDNIRNNLEIIDEISHCNDPNTSNMDLAINEKNAKIQSLQQNIQEDLEANSHHDLKKQKISYLLQNHICEETIITRCSIPLGFTFKSNNSNKS